MYIKRVMGYITPYTLPTKALFDTFKPVTQESKKWKQWITHIGPNTCELCYFYNGKIISINEEVEVPAHFNCHCELCTKIAVVAGNATNDGENGADYWLKHYERLPDYYVSRDEYIDAGWKSGKPPAKWYPGKMMYGRIYRNDKGKLPNAIGRIWCEADINYYEGRRNKHRIYFSNDGLIFVSYNHGGNILRDSLGDEINEKNKRNDN